MRRIRLRPGREWTKIAKNAALTTTPSPLESVRIGDRKHRVETGDRVESDSPIAHASPLAHLIDVGGSPV